MSEKSTTIMLKGKLVDDLRKLREKTGIPIIQMVSLVLNGYTIIEISTNKDLLKELKKIC